MIQPTVDQKRELEAAALLILISVLSFLAVFAAVVVMATRWWLS